MSGPGRKEMLKRLGYSLKAIDILESKLNIGEIESPDIYISDESSCGDLLILYLAVDDDTIVDAKFQYIGCAGMQLAASTVTKLVKGVRLEDAAHIRPEDIIDYLVRIPKYNLECVEFAVETLHKALNKRH